MRGVVILAGGEGSRCGANGAKGMIPLLGKSLFERICEKIRDRAPIAILTSPQNNKAIVQFFQKNNFYYFLKMASSTGTFNSNLSTCISEKTSPFTF